MTRHKIVALLPLKENSARIKGKNFKNFAGQPLFHWILDSLKNISIIDKIIINTDARETLLKHEFIESERPVNLKIDGSVIGFKA